MNRPIAALCAGVLFISMSAVVGCGSGESISPTPRSRSIENSGGGGEKSIENFGSEASGSSRSNLLTAFHGYLDALAGREYGAACEYLSARVHRALEQLVARNSREPGCAAILPRILAPSAPGIARRQASGEVTKIRTRGDHAFVIFQAPGAKLYQLAMAREGGRWKGAIIAPSVLVPSAATLGR